MGDFILKRILKGLLFLLLIVCVLGISFTVMSEKLNPSNSHVNLSKNAKVNIVALGDSLTQGVGDPKKSGGYVSRIKEQLQKRGYKNVESYNYGIAGQRSDQINARIKQNKNGLTNKLRKANVIVLTVGGNDLLQSLQKNALIGSESQFERNMDGAIKKYQNNLQTFLSHVRRINATAPIYVYGIYNPVYVYFPNVTNISQYVDKFNVITSNKVKQYRRMHFVDIHELTYGQFKTKEQRLKLENSNKSISINPFNLIELDGSQGEINNYISPTDHFHPNDKGYNFMTSQLLRAMEKNKDIK